MSDVMYTRRRSDGPFETMSAVQVAAPSSTIPMVTLAIDNSSTRVGETNTSSWACTGISPMGTPFDVLIGETMVDTLIIPQGSTGSPGAAHNNSTGQLFIETLNSILSDMPVPSVDSELISLRTFAEIYDKPTKNFKKRFAAGEVINNSVFNVNIAQKVSYESHVPLSASQKLTVSPWNGTYYGVTQMIPNVENLPAPSNEDVKEIMLRDRTFWADLSSFDSRQTAINSAFGAINSGSYEYLVELGEAKETIAYIALVFTRIANMIKAVRRGEFDKGLLPRTHQKCMRRAKRRARANGTAWQKEYAIIAVDFATSAWMELRFAIRPLVIGVEQAIELHQQGLKSHSGRSVINNIQGSSGSDSESIITIDDKYRTIRHTSVATTRTAAAGVLIQINAAIDNARTLGFTNIAGTAWELTFLSWAADYFINLDGLLYHLTPDIGVDRLAAWSSAKDEIVVSTTLKRYDVETGKLLDTVLIETVKNVYDRYPIDSPSYLTLDINIDVYKLADLGALFYGFLKSAKTTGVIK